MKVILSMCTESLRILRDDYDRRINRNRYMIDSAEAKLKRVEPLSVEFEETVGLIENARGELNRLHSERLQIHHEICSREMGIK